MQHLATAIVDTLLEKIEDRGMITWLDDEDFAANRDDFIAIVATLIELDRQGR